MRIIEADDETIIVPINRRTHKVSIRDESDTRQTIYIEPIEALSLKPRKQEEEK